MQSTWFTTELWPLVLLGETAVCQRTTFFLSLNWINQPNDRRIKQCSLNANTARSSKTGVKASLTLRESKQAITRPFSTWQLRDGWANLHSVSDREQVPLWNSRHTSKVSHFVSRTKETFIAILKRKSTHTPKEKNENANNCTLLQENSADDFKRGKGGSLKKSEEITCCFGKISLVST